jgi:hypothetical protein
VARGNQSKTSIGLDRRELLAATAVVTAAGIVPNADAVGATNSAQVVNAARVSLSGNEALNVSTSTGQHGPVLRVSSNAGSLPRSRRQAYGSSAPRNTAGITEMAAGRPTHRGGLK